MNHITFCYNFPDDPTTYLQIQRILESASGGFLPPTFGFDPTTCLAHFVGRSASRIAANRWWGEHRPVGKVGGGVTTDYFSQKDLDDFRRDGLLVVRRMYDAKEIRALSGWIEGFASKPPEKGRQMVYLEESLLRPGKKILSRIEKFADYDGALRDFVYDPRITGRVAELLGESALLFKEKMNFKLPGGGGFKPHQDIQPGWEDYAPYFISALVTIDESTAENGCLELAAGHHKRGMIGRRWEPLQGKELNGITFKKYPMSPGDAAFFDCFVPHQSKPNLTDKPRRNLYLTFNRASDGEHREKYFADKRKNYPPDNERELGKEYVFKV